MFVVGLFIIFQCYALSLGHHWALLAIVTSPYSSSLVGPFVIIQQHVWLLGHPCCHWIVTWPVLIVIGGPIGCHWVELRAYSLSLECCQAHFHWVSLLDCPTLHGLLGPCSLMLASFAWPWWEWDSCVLFDTLVLGKTSVLSMWSGKEEREK